MKGVLRLSVLCNGTKCVHIGNMNGFPIDLQDPVPSEFTQGPNHVLGGHAHIIGHLFPGKGEIKFLGIEDSA